MFCPVRHASENRARQAPGGLGREPFEDFALPGHGGNFVFGIAVGLEQDPAGVIDTLEELHQLVERIILRIQFAHVTCGSEAIL